ANAAPSSSIITAGTWLVLPIPSLCCQRQQALYHGVPNVSPMHDTGIFGNAYDDEDVEEEVDMNNVVSFIQDKWAIGTKWVFRNKKDERGIVVKNKARLVAQGHTQEKGIDYDEVFAPVARIEAIRLFLAYASFKDFVVYHMDVKSAFLYGKIEEEVYVYQPLGFVDPHFPDKVYKVEKALYGLHQAPRAWYETLLTYLLDNGFHKGQICRNRFNTSLHNTKHESKKTRERETK
ncbi:putative ribonuclease H-like domain-containing protein, partial [Tanacetum coccineum]